MDLEAAALALAERLPIFDVERNELGTIRYHGQEEKARFRLTYTLADAAWGRRAETLVEVMPTSPGIPAEFSLFDRVSKSDADLSEPVALGDKLFDRRWGLTGDPLGILAAVDAECRALIGRCAQLSVSNGWVYLPVEGHIIDPEALEAQIRHALTLARHLARGLSRERRAERLLANLRLERSGHVRIKLTSSLFRHFPGSELIDALLDFWLVEYEREQRSPVRLRVLKLVVEHARPSEKATQLLEKALLDPSPDIRLFATRHLGQEGLLVMSRVATTRFASEETRIDALFLLGERAEADAFRSALLACAKDSAPRVRRYALKRLLDDPRPELPEELVRIARGSDREAAEDLAELLGQVAGNVSEPALLALLANRSPRVRRAAVLGLGQMGTVAAVPALLEFAKPIILDGSLRELAHDAILKIQHRIQSGEAGGLSLIEAGEQAGALSTPETELGALSFRPSSPDENPS